MVEQSPATDRLTERTSISVWDGGAMRIPRHYWRELGTPSDVTCDLVKTDKGLEVRLKV